ncbi:HEPN_Apea domain-containing protein [Candidatus Nitrotoga sp. 1052]|nr:HEPN_Apea domain-containing protein [Candidatus Nitrotoga sp. 1052]
MQDQGLLEFKSFFGNLQAGSNTAPITFRSRIDGSGKVEFDFGAIVLTKETSFIMKWWDGEGSRPGYFSLSGKAEDGTEFKTVDLHFNSLANKWCKETGSRMSPIGGCSRAEFHRKLAAQTPKPTLRMYVKGFQNLRQLSSECCLGIVAMVGESSINDPDNITGYIAVQSDNEPADLTAWHAQADKLLEHIRRVMSFASATVLKRPVIEFYSGDDLKVVALTQTRQLSTPFRTFHYLNQQPVFDAAVTSFFNPPFELKNFFFAIEWFAMEATYKEVSLVNVMTALENLVASNLGVNDKLIQPKKEFKILRKVLKQRIEKWSTDEANIANGIVGELDEKLAELNRRSLLNNLMILTQRWSVPLDGIGEDKINAAKKARDLIVHQGHYPNDGKDVNDDLWEHVTVIREIVVRFLLTAIGYRGGYFSYIGGCHDAQFPPQADDKNAKQSTPQQTTGY